MREMLSSGLYPARGLAALLGQLQSGSSTGTLTRLDRAQDPFGVFQIEYGNALALFQAGADVNAKDAMQDSAYLYAGARGLDEILAMTLAHGADLRSTNRYGGTALIPAAERGHVATVRTLLRAGVAVDHVNRLHWTALLEAILLGDGGARHVQIVQLLLEAGADPELADGDGVTPLAHARQRGYTGIETLLRQHGAVR